MARPQSRRRAVRIFRHEVKEKWVGRVPLDTTGTSKADEEAFSLIMQRKEDLLSFEEPVSFIFSHSALREGWDNPNVFQICTMREVGSDTVTATPTSCGVCVTTVICHDLAVWRKTPTGYPSTPPTFRIDSSE